MYDAIVIGSGIGGLITAGLPARVAGGKVLAPEKHIEPRGLTRMSHCDGFSQDVELHCIGQLEPGGLLRAYLDYLSGDELVWSRVPDTYDRFVYPDINFPTPSDSTEYQRRLIEALPAEAYTIRRYSHDIRNINRWNTLNFTKHMVPGAVAPLLRGIQQISGRMAFGITQRYLKRCFRSPRLRALLASQWGDYELPPSFSTLATHTIIVRHHLNDAWFPEDGDARVAQTSEKDIE